MHKPQGSSTPFLVQRVSGRRSIHRVMQDENYSPILDEKMKRKTQENEKERPEYVKERQEYDKGEQEYDKGEQEYDKEKQANGKKKQKNVKGNSKNDITDKTEDFEQVFVTQASNKQVNNSGNDCQKVWLDYLKDDKFVEYLSNLLLYLIVFIVILLIPSNSVSNNHKTIVNNLKNKFPNQDTKFWVYFSSGINDAVRFNKPSVILIMYTEETGKITEEILENMSKYAFGRLKDGKNADFTGYVGNGASEHTNLDKPIVLDSTQLNTAQYLEDYGKIIVDLKPRIEKSRVMLLKNFDKLKPEVARAFHAICDEYTPLVGRSFFIFTVKVDEYVGTEFEQIRGIFRGFWGELDEDALEALIARVTNVVLRVRG